MSSSIEATVERSERWVRRLLGALSLIVVALLCWLLFVTTVNLGVARTTNATTRHTDAAVLSIVKDDQARIASLSSDIAGLTAVGNANAAQVTSLEHQLATVHAELNAVLAATTSAQRQAVVQQYSTPSTTTTTAKPRSTTTTTRPKSTTTTTVCRVRNPRSGACLVP